MGIIFSIKYSMRSFLIFLFLFFLFPAITMAGGPLFVNDKGVAATWDNTVAVPYHPESGDCATFSNAAMLLKITENLNNWTDIANIILSFNQEAGVIGPVDASNYLDFIAFAEDETPASDDSNPVIFDDDGEIVADLFGASNKFFVLGFAAPDGFSDDRAEIIDGQAVFNCFCLAGNTNDTGDECAALDLTETEDELDFTMVHEFGHFLNFDHTQVNESIANDGCDTDVDNDCDDIPTMYPQAVDAADQITPHTDDIVTALTLYGNATLTDNFCTVTGELEDKNGNEMRCADVQATTNDPADTVAMVSGAFAPVEDTDGDGATDGDGECLSACGGFTLRGLNPAKDYTITVRPINPAWIGASSVGPCVNEQPTGIVVEEIASISGCTAGGTTNLGTVVTESEIDGDGGNGNGSSTECGEGSNFENCDELVSCGLSLNHQGGSSSSMLILFLFGLATMRFFKAITRNS